MEGQYTVIAIVEAQPGKENELENLLQHVAEQSRAEEACVSYKLHKGIESQQFVLYEKWATPEKHQEQFSKPYIQDFMNKAEELLAQSPQIITTNEI